MQYHAMSLASHGVRVTLVGYAGERCISAVEDNPHITTRRFEPALSGPWGCRLKRRAYLAFALIKALTLLVRFVYELIILVGKPDAILVQNPPALPGLACVYLACLCHRCPMVLDWHNLGFTMFGRGPRHPLVWITRRAEAFFGRRARINITVSRGMRDWVRTTCRDRFNVEPRGEKLIRRKIQNTCTTEKLGLELVSAPCLLRRLGSALVCRSLLPSPTMVQYNSIITARLAPCRQCSHRRLVGRWSEVNG